MDTSNRVWKLVEKKHKSGLTKADRIEAVNCLLEDLVEILRWTTANKLGDEHLRCYLYTDGSHSRHRLEREIEFSKGYLGNGEEELLSTRGFFSRHFTPGKGLPDGKEFASVKFGFDRDGKWHAYKIMLRLTEESLTGPTTPVSITEETGDIPMKLTDPKGEYASLGITLDDFRRLVVDTAEHIRGRAEESHRRAANVEEKVNQTDSFVQYVMK